MNSTVFINWDAMTDAEIDLVAFHAGEIQEHRRRMYDDPNFSCEWHERQLAAHGFEVIGIIGEPEMMTIGFSDVVIGMLEVAAIAQLEARGVLVMFEGVD